MIIEDEFEYHVISQLIEMPNKELAQKVELMIWPRGPQPDAAVLQKIVDLNRQSTDSENFIALLEEFVNQSGQEFMLDSGLAGNQVTRPPDRKGDFRSMSQCAAFIISRLRHQSDQKWHELAECLKPVFAILEKESER